MTLSRASRESTPQTPQTPQSDRERRAAENRARMPDAYQVIDAFRSVFGDGIKVVYVKEGDVELGKPLRIPENS